MVDSPKMDEESLNHKKLSQQRDNVPGATKGRKHSETFNPSGDAVTVGEDPRCIDYKDSLPPASTQLQGFPPPYNSAVSNVTDLTGDESISISGSLKASSAPESPDHKSRVENSTKRPAGDKTTLSLEDDDDNKIICSAISAKTDNTGAPTSRVPERKYRPAKITISTQVDLKKDVIDECPPAGKLQSNHSNQESTESKAERGNLFDVITSNFILLPFASPLSKRTFATRQSSADLNGFRNSDKKMQSDMADETTSLLAHATSDSEGRSADLAYSSMWKAPATEPAVDSQQEKQDAEIGTCQVINSITPKDLRSEVLSHPPPPSLSTVQDSKSRIPEHATDANYYQYLYLKQAYNTLHTMPHYRYLNDMAAKFQLHSLNNIRGNANGANTKPIQYYKFSVTKSTPFTALYKRPPTAANTLGAEGASIQSISAISGPANSATSVYQPQQCTGLLRRSAVLPAHQTILGCDRGEWVLVNVGGRSGWARRESSRNSSPKTDLHPSQGGNGGYLKPVETFRWKDLWMGNHIFLW